MDRISFAGLLIGLLVIVAGHLLEGGSLGSLIQPTAFLIVIGGTLGAVMLQSPLKVFKKGMAMAKWVFFPPINQPDKLIADIVRWSNIARKEGLLALEAQIRAQSDPFIAKGLQLLADGAELADRHLLAAVDVREVADRAFVSDREVPRLGDGGAGADAGALPAWQHGADQPHPRALGELGGDPADAHLPPGVPVADALGEARGVGGPEAGDGALERTLRGANQGGTHERGEEVLLRSPVGADDAGAGGVGVAGQRGVGDLRQGREGGGAHQPGAQGRQLAPVVRGLPEEGAGRRGGLAGVLRQHHEARIY